MFVTIWLHMHKTSARADLYKWVCLSLHGASDLEGQIPSGAVIGGWERGRPTYVARVLHHGCQWELGKLNAWARYGYSYYGKEYESSEGDILVASKGQVCL